MRRSAASAAKSGRHSLGSSYDAAMPRKQREHAARRRPTLPSRPAFEGWPCCRPPAALGDEDRSAARRGGLACSPATKVIQLLGVVVIALPGTCRAQRGLAKNGRRRDGQGASFSREFECSAAEAAALLGNVLVARRLRLWPSADEASVVANSGVCEQNNSPTMSARDGHRPILISATR